MVNVAGGASNLEYDLEDGKRGDRDSQLKAVAGDHGCRGRNCRVHNAAAVLLVLNTLANRKEVPVSRGELLRSAAPSEFLISVWRGLSCRSGYHKPDTMTIMDAISSKTGALMKVHSNYMVQGFTKEVSGQELSRLSGKDCPH